jgi:hypothetical protein
VTRAGLACSLVLALGPEALAQPAPAEPAPAGEPPAGSPAPTADDLSKAADAAAEVATIPPPAAATPATPPRASSDDIDLSSLGLDPTASAAGFDDKLNIYGFADFNYEAEHLSAKLPGINQNTRGFVSGAFNIYLAKNLTAKARSLGEVRFTFLPNGSQNADGSHVSTDAQDFANFMRIVQWGGIVIERAYIEYDLTDWLTIRGGHWLTPYGIWNIDHGSPAIIATNRPYIIGEQFFPEHQTGFDAFGSKAAAGFKVDYHLTVSNGRGATEAVADQDNKLAFGGRVEIETPWGLKAGGSYYRGRYTGLAVAAGALPETFREASYGGDAQFALGRLHLQTEVIARERHYIAGARAATAAGFAPDSRDFGLYALADYRFDQLWNVAPYVYYERYKPGENAYFDGLHGIDGGFNFRPAPTVVLKLQGSYGKFDSGNLPLSGTSVSFFQAQVSWVF